MLILGTGVSPTVPQDQQGSGVNSENHSNEKNAMNLAVHKINPIEPKNSLHIPYMHSLCSAGQNLNAHGHEIYT